MTMFDLGYGSRTVADNIRLENVEKALENVEKALVEIRITLERLNVGFSNHLAHHDRWLRYGSIIIVPLTAFAALVMQMLAKALGWL